jgi:hypothetical protein
MAPHGWWWRSASLEMDVILSVIGGIIAAIAGWLAGWLWDYYKYRKERRGEYVLQIKLSPKVYNHDNLKFIDVEIKMQNSGGGAAFIKCPDPKGKENPILEVKKIPIETRDSIISWDTLPYLFPPIEFLKDFYYPRSDVPYIIEPGDTAIEHACFTTTYDGILILRASLWDQKGFRVWEQTILEMSAFSASI